MSEPNIADIERELEQLDEDQSGFYNTETDEENDQENDIVMAEEVEEPEMNIKQIEYDTSNFPNTRCYVCNRELTPSDIAEEYILDSSESDDIQVPYKCPDDNKVSLMHIRY